MKIQPIKSAPPPSYPDKYSAASKQAVSCAVPRRWATTPLALSLAAAVALGVTGCRETNLPPPVLGDNATQNQTPTISEGVFIPLFEFGNGTGGFVCIAVNSPAFFSEEEAFAILASSFAEAGLNLDTSNGLRLSDLPEVSMEFISIEDAEHIPSPDGLASSSFDLKVTAQQRGASTSMLAVFYDPISYTERNFNEETARWSNEQWQQHYTESHKAALAESEVFLRQQANAFVEWLLAEGLIESRLPVGG